MVPFTAPVKAGIALASAGVSAVSSVASGLQNKKIADRNALILGMNAKREQEIALRAADDFARDEERRRASGRAKGKGRTDEGSGLLVQVDQAGEAAYQALRIVAGGATRAATLRNEASGERARGEAARTAGFLKGATTLGGAAARHPSSPSPTRTPGSGVVIGPFGKWSDLDPGPLPPAFRPRYDTPF